MPRRVLILVLVFGATLLVLPSTAWAASTTGQNGTHTSASAGDGTVTVGVGIHRHHQPPGSDPPPGTPGSAGSPGSGSVTQNSDPPTSGTTPVTDEVTCTDEIVNLVEFQSLLGVGGPEPGAWAIQKCTGPNGPVIRPPVWVYLGQPGTPGSPATNTTPTPPPSPVGVALQAEKQLQLPASTIEMAPPATAEQLVGVSAWLWENPSAWKPYTATASIDGVTASATATPEEVVWNMGDGHSVTCSGPGTAYDPSDPSASTDCSYTWESPSASQASGTYTVTATIEFAVAWSAVGAAGGGNLGLVPGATATAEVHVGESEALNTSAATSSGSA